MSVLSRAAIGLVLLLESIAARSDVDISVSAAQGSGFYEMLGSVASGAFGGAVADAGDVNGDGLSDLVIGSYVTNSDDGMATILFGASGRTATSIDTLTMTTAEGVKTTGSLGTAFVGYAVSTAGDLNKDGFDDVLIGAPYLTLSGGRANIGGVLVIFGQASADWADIDITTLTGDGLGFFIYGATLGDRLGYSVSAAGDMNGDGNLDLIIGTPYVSDNGIFCGAAYVIFGKGTATTASNIDYANFAGSGYTGFIALGAAAQERFGESVSAAGDINGDGYDDVVIGSFGGTYPGRNIAGLARVLFGHSPDTPFNDIVTSSLAAPTGFTIYGASDGDYLGKVVGAAGDVNVDGYDDLLLSTTTTRYAGRISCGGVYVLFGHSNGTAFPDLDFANFATGTDGYRVLGATDYDNLGVSVSGAVDVNNDGIDDIVLGASGDGNLARSGTGITYVIFGQPSTYTFADIDTASLTAAEGFTITGGAADDHLGLGVALVRDLDGDGVGDVLVGATGADPSSRADAGAAYLVYGEGNPTAEPTAEPTLVPTADPSLTPTAAPTITPSANPSADPTINPSAAPSIAPTPAPSADPTLAPTPSPTNAPTAMPSAEPTVMPSASPSVEPTVQPSRPTASPSAQMCEPGTHATPLGGCMSCPVDSYSDEAEAVTCQECSYPYGTVDEGSTECATVQVGLPALGTAPLFGLLGVFVLCCLAMQVASLTAAVVLMVVVSTADMLTDLVYILSAKFATGAVFGLCVAFFLLRAAPFLYRLYEMGHWHPCFRASFYTLPEGWTVNQPTLQSAAFAMVVIYLSPIYLVAHIAAALLWLLVGCFLYSTRLLAIARVKNFWSKVWMGEVTAAFTASGTDASAVPAAFAEPHFVVGWDEDLILLAVFIALPEIILQLYNQEKVEYTAIGIISVIASGLVLVLAIVMVVLSRLVADGSVAPTPPPGDLEATGEQQVQDQEHDQDQVRSFDGAEPTVEGEAAAPEVREG